MIGQIRKTQRGFVLAQGTQHSAVNGKIYFETRGELSDALRARGLHVYRDGSVAREKEPEEVQDLSSPEDPQDPALKYGPTGPANEPTADDVLKYAARDDEEGAPTKPAKKKS